MSKLFGKPSPERVEYEAWLTTKEAYAGHPTVPGPPDPYVVEAGKPSPGNGVPGVPRVLPSPEGHGPGIPGTTPTGPMQPGSIYDGPLEDL